MTSRPPFAPLPPNAARTLIENGLVNKLHMRGVPGGFHLEFELTNGDVLALANPKGEARHFCTGESVITTLRRLMNTSQAEPYLPLMNAIEVNILEWTPDSPRANTRPDRAQALRKTKTVQA